MHLIRRSAVALAATMLVLLSIGPGIALAVDVQHGIGLTKGCTSPTKIGDPYTCAFQVRNILDEAEDTLTIFSIVDVVHAASGDVNSGNILGSVRVTTVDIGGNQTGSTCAAASGSGTVADPYLGVTSCTLPFNSRVTILPFSHYTVQAGDFALPNHQLRDDVFLGWTDTCNDPAGTGNSNCDPNPPANASSSLTLIQQLVSSTATDIHNAAHQVVTAVAVGTTVHDLVTVTGQPGAPVPTGNVNIDWFLNGDCTGAPAQNSGSVGPLAADGTLDATGFNFTVNTAGMRAFRAHYEGDATYTGSDGPCEPLRVVNARISINPNAANEVGVPHTFTVTLEKDTGDGAGFVAAAGEHVDVTLTDTNGASHSAPTGTCTNAGANTDAAGQCTITFTSLTSGTVTGHATATLSVAGSPLTRSTDAVPPNSGDATKVFQDANIQITPNGTNRVGASHTFTAHVNANLGQGAGFQNAPDGTVITFTTVDANGATSAPNPPTSCTTSGGTGSCSTTISSPTTGTSTVSAHTTFTTPGGVTLTRSTDGVGANSVPAVKTWVNARISITPTATNEINAPHTFTVTLQRDNGDGAGFVAFSGAHVSVTLANSSGAGFVLDAAASTCDDAGANTDAAGQCVIVFTSPTPGQVTGTASWTGSLGTPTPFTVTTDGTGGSSGPAVKTFVDANLQISPLTDNNPVSTNHTLTGHVNVNAGLGAGYVNAPAGTVIDFSLTNAGGATAAFVGPSTCATVGTTGSCTVVISSPTTGTTTIGAVTTVTVGGVSLHRETGDGLPGDSADAVKRWADDTVRTDVHNAAHTVITKVAVGTVVHDKVFVTRTAATPVEVPNPTGSVVFHRYANLTCTGTAVDQTVALGADGTAESASFTTTGDLCYRADYLGDANYPARSGANEPLRVIRPATSLTTVGTPVTKVKTGDVVTITINEKNVGDDPISDVHVTGGSTGGTVDCTWAPVDPAFDGTLDPGESQDFFCTFTVGTAQLSWEALGQGTDSLGNPVDDDGEYLSAMPETAGITPFSRPAGAGLSPWLSLAAVAILLIGLAFITPVPARVRRRTR